MSWRVAVTSADGVLINQHFGHAAFFWIIDLEADGSFRVAEKRETRPWCRPGSDASDASPAENIADCAAVLTARVGPPARKKLELANITVFEQPDTIERALRKLAAYWGKTRAV